MTLQECRDMIRKDVPDLDLSALEHESSRSFQLWNKYHFLYLEELSKLQDLESKLNTLKANRSLYYQGKGTEEEYKEKPYPMKHVKTEAKEFVEVDPDVVRLYQLFHAQESVVAHLKKASEEIAKRSFYIQEATKNLLFHNARE